MGQLILVLGGARSGKSTFAQELAQQLGGKQVLFVATARAGDEEMQQRIKKHRCERLSGWETLEAQRDVGRSLAAYPDKVQVVLIDCLTLLVSNLLMDVEDPFAAEAETVVMAEIQALATYAAQRSAHVIIVSNEVGMGVVPPYPLGRAYRDLLGKANQVLAQEADQVHLLVAGIPLRLKG